jgi:hypothetical protein
MFNRTGLRALTTPEAAPVFGRFEASRPNEIWTGDAERHEAPRDRVEVGDLRRYAVAAA